MVVYKKYGEVFKKFRKQRGFKLTSFESIGISAAALCKFERGISLLKFDKLVLALSELSITLAEYEKSLSDYDLDIHEELIREIILAGVLGNNNSETLFRLCEKAKQLRENYLALAIKGCYRPLTYEEVEILNDYFEHIAFWRYTDLYTLYLSLDKLEISQSLFLIEDFFVSHTEVFNSLEHRIRLTQVICRFSMFLISKGYMEKAHYLLDYLQSKKYEHTMFTKNIMNFVVGYWESEFGETEQGLLLMRTSLEHFDLLSFPGISEYYKKLYEMYSKKTFQKQ